MDWHAYSIPFQRGVEITDSERNILTNRIDSKIKEISNEDTDETFIEFLLELLSQGTSFGEIAENLQDVLMNPADWVSKLCEWLVGQVKEVLKLELTPAEKQFASMAEQLASAKKELEKKSNTNVNKDNEKLSIKKNQNSGSNSNANGGNNIKKKEGISLASLRENRKRRLEEKDNNQDKDKFKKDQNYINVSRKQSNTLAVQYKEYLNSGFTGDFAQFLDKDKIIESKNDDTEIEGKNTDTRSTILAPEEIAQRQQMMTWSANPIQNKPLVNPLAPEEIAKRQEKMTWSSTTVAAKVVSNSNIVNSNTSIKKISSHISTDKLSERKNAMTWTNNATAVHNSSNSSTFANSYNSQRGGVNFGRGRRGGASQTLVSPRTNMTWTAGSTNQTNSQNNSQYTTPNNSNNESNNQQQQNVIFGSAVISQHPGSARGVFTPRGRGSYRARGSFRGRGSFIANRFNKFDNQSFQNQQWVKSGNNNVNDMNNQVQQISNTLPETPPPP